MPDPDHTVPSLASELLAAETPRDEKLNKVVGGKYRLVRQLSAGGMGTVYRGEHTSLGIKVAVKFMHAHIARDSNLVARFRREAYAMSLLDHRNIVRVLDFGEDGGELFMVMEFLEGESLSEYLARFSEPPPLENVVTIVRQVFDAFEVAHGAGIVHRDLKPDNLFLTYPNNPVDPVVKVVDFGLAHVETAEHKLTQTGAVAGTPQYMSPEQCRSLSVGPASDLYSIGCILTELLQLSPPFNSSSPAELMAQHMFAPPRPLLRPVSSPEVPPLLEKLRLELLAKSPDGRPPSAAEARERLLLAFDRDRARSVLPPRKNELEAGDRAARLPSWGPPPPQASTMVSQQTASADVALVRVSPDEGDGGDWALGLSSQGITLHEIGPGLSLADKPFAAALVYGGSDVAAIVSTIERIKAAAPSARAVVCAKGLDVEKINRLVSAGAADALNRPVGAENLARRLLRVLRRKR